MWRRGAAMASLLHSPISSPSSPLLSSQENIAACASPSSTPTSAYIHLPFCRRRCHYCDFPIVAIGSRQGAHVDSAMESYVETLCREMVSAHSHYKSSLVDEVLPLQTVFFGGGTPSLLPPPLLGRILEMLDKLFGIESGAEVSLEMDPGTFDSTSLHHFMQLGVNRVSLGVQAFQEELLRACGRSHGVLDVNTALDIIHSSGLTNFSLDLISSLPHQTHRLWLDSLHKAIAAKPAHISVYDLQVENGTNFARWYKPGQSPLPLEDASAELYRTASASLGQAGYHHYEISNYAKPGFECRHNLVYWNNFPYYGFGLGSTSYVGRQRFSRPKKLGEYERFVKELEQKNGRIDWPKDSREEGALDTILLSFRLARGLDINKFTAEFGSQMANSVVRTLLPFVNSGHAFALDRNSQPLLLLSVDCIEKKEIGFIRLSDPEGFLLSNEIISSIFASISK